MVWIVLDAWRVLPGCSFCFFAPAPEVQRGRAFSMEASMEKIEDLRLRPVSEHVCKVCGAVRGALAIDQLDRTWFVTERSTTLIEGDAQTRLIELAEREPCQCQTE